MSDANKLEAAKKVYQALCSALDRREWKYTKHEEKLGVNYGVVGDSDIPVQYVVQVEPDRYMIRLLSPMPFKMGEDKRMEGAIAVCAATYKLVDGSFDFDLSDGVTIFRLTACYRDSDIGEGLLEYMISCASFTMNRYAPLFQRLNEGTMSIADFLKQEC